MQGCHNTTSPTKASSTISTNNGKCDGGILGLVTPRKTTNFDPLKCQNTEPYSSPCGWFSSHASFNVCGIQRLIPFCQSGKRAPLRRPLKIKGLGKKISNCTLHGIESVNDLRSWSQCNCDRRRHFLEFMNPVLNEDVIVTTCFYCLTARLMFRMINNCNTNTCILILFPE